MIKNRSVRTLHFNNFINTCLYLLFFSVYIGVNAQVSEESPVEISTFNYNSSENKHNIFSQVKFEYGGIIASVKKMGIEDYYGSDIRVGWQKRKNDVYSTLYNAPKFGVGIYASTFVNEAFGSPLGLYGFFDIPVHFPRSKWSWVYSLGLGMAFDFNYYDPITNPGNKLLGSDMNVYFALSFEGKYSITPEWTTGFGLGFKHFSNGRIHLPNRGINLIPVTLSAQYNFGKNYTDLKKNNVTEFTPFNIISIFGAVGNKNFEYGKSVYFKSSLSASYLRQFNYKFRYGGGLELFYTAGSLDRIESDKNDFNKQFSYGITGNLEWVITERLYLPINFGIHLNYNVENFEQFLYQRLGLRYLIGKDKKMMAGVNLKVTEFHADYVEWTIGYSFKNDPNKYKLLF